MKRNLPLVFVFFVKAALGQYAVTNAVGAGMGQATAAQGGPVSLMGNPAGLVSLESWCAAVAAERRFAVAELQSVALGAALPTQAGTFGLQLQSFGYEEFRQQKAGLAYARRLFQALSIGAQFDYYQTRIPEYGSRGVLSFELGLQADISKRVTIGMQAFNPAQVEFAEGENLPTVLLLGLACKFSDKLLVVSDLEKDLESTLRWRTGLAYTPMPALTLRTGFATEPSVLYFGLGFAFSKAQGRRYLRADTAGSFHQVLGFTPVAGMTWY